MIREALASLAPGVFSSNINSVDVDLIFNHYRHVQRKKLRRFELPNPAVLSSVCQGLGDTVMLTDLPKASGGKFQSFSPSEHFRPLMKFNKHWRETDDKHLLINAPDLVRQYDCGNGHYIQRVRRAFGCPVDDKPKGHIGWSGKRHTSRVVMHFDPGKHALWQRKEIHPQARAIYPGTRIELERFVRDNRQYEFVEVGKKSLRLHGVKHIPTENTSELIEEIAKASWFIGIISGPMHVATALGLKCVVIINFPDPTMIFLPTLVVTGACEEEWFYPQNVHLHQEGDGPQVRKATCDNIKRAFDFKVFPYGSDAYLQLIHENL